MMAASPPEPATPRPFSRCLRGGCLFLAALWLPLSAAGQDFQSRISEEALARACTQYRAGTLIADFKPESKAFPETGGLVRFVMSKSVAESLGIVSGSVILRRGPFAYGDARDAFDPRNKQDVDNAAGELSWVNPDNTFHTAQVGPGRLGVNHGEQRNLAYWYLRHGQRDGRWDVLVLTALLSQTYDPAVSESCWAAALAKGYKPDQLSHWSGIFLAIARGDHEAAEAHATAFGPPKRPGASGDFPLLPGDWTELAYQTGNMKWLVQAGKYFLPHEYDQADAKWLTELAAENPRPPLPPSKLADSMKRTSFLRSGSWEGPQWAQSGGPGRFKDLLQQLMDSPEAPGAESKPVILRSALDHPTSLWLCPAEPSPNLDLVIECKMKPAAATGRPSQYYRSLIFGLANREEAEGPKSLIPGKARILVTETSFGATGVADDPRWVVYTAARTMKWGDEVWNGFQSVQRDLATSRRPAFHQGEETFHMLRIVCVNGWAEALVDGKRIALTPVPEDASHPGLFLRVIGASMEVKSLRADILE